MASLTRSTRCAGIGILVQRIHSAEHDTGVRVDQLHIRQIPAGVAQRDCFQMAKTAGNLKAFALDSASAIAATLTSDNLLAERASQGLAVGRLAPDRLSLGKASQRRCADLAVQVAVIIVLEPIPVSAGSDAPA